MVQFILTVLGALVGLCLGVALFVILELPAEPTFSLGKPAPWQTYGPLALGLFGAVGGAGLGCFTGLLVTRPE